MSMEAAELLSRPVVTGTGQPLRVAVYSRLAEGIRSAALPLGSLLPKEVELGRQLGVSRTVVREALMLLEEDGLIVTKRGVGRSIADRLPAVGLDVFRPFEEVLAVNGRTLRITTTEFCLQPTTDFISRGIGVDGAANTWFRESVAYRDDDAVAVIQEHLPAGKYLSDINADIARLLEGMTARNGTLLSIINATLGPILGSAECDVAPGSAGPSSRARLLGLASADPVLVLTQRANYASSPLYLAKCVVSHAAGPFTIVQSSQS
ncbi:MAG: GntR family transcriptional regulator [Specibacter sp.]